MLFVIILILLLLFVLILFAISFKIFKSSCDRNDKSIFEIFKKRGINFENRIVKPNIEWLKEQDIKDVYIKSRDGLKLHGVFLPASNAYRTIICVHGYRGKYYTDFSAIIKYLNANHSNVLLIEQRCHGESEGRYITYGAKEKYDVVDWVNYTMNKLDDKNPIYLYGISMGCSTSLLSLNCDMPGRVRGVIADCGYTSMKDQLTYVANKWYNVPAFPIVNIINLFCNLLANFDMKDTDTTTALKENITPIMFIHGEEDTFVIPENARQNYAKTCGPKEMVWVKGADHGEAVIANPELYHNRLEYFFDTYK